MSKQRECIQLLLQEKSINLSLADKEDRTCFGVALLNKDQETAKAILKCYKNAAEETNSRGMTFLHTAVSGNDVETVKFLLSVGVNLNTPVSDPSQRTALALAVTNGSTVIVELLLKARADFSVTDPLSRWTPLHVAASTGHVEIVELLIKAGADVNAADDLGDTPLHAAIRAGCKVVADKLIVFDSTNVSALNKAQQTPLHYIGLYPKEASLPIFQSLGKRISEINPLDAEGNTPLFYAYQSGSGPVAKALVLAGAHLAMPNSLGIISVVV